MLPPCSLDFLFLLLFSSSSIFAFSPVFFLFYDYDCFLIGVISTIVLAIWYHDTNHYDCCCILLPAVCATTTVANIMVIINKHFGVMNTHHGYYYCLLLVCCLPFA